MLARTDAETISSGDTGYSVVFKPGHFSNYLNEPFLELFLNIVIYKENFSAFAMLFHALGQFLITSVALGY